MHTLWLRKVYSYMGAVYFVNTNKKIEIFEYLLFLVQWEVMQTKNKSFLKEKIHIDGDKIRIKYISDLIRVKPFCFVRALGEELDSLGEYVDIMEKYISMGDSQIETKVLSILKENELDKKYFVFKKYKSNFMRCKARLFANDVGVKSFIRTYMLNLPTLAMLFVLVYACLYVPTIDKSIFQKNFHVIIFFGAFEVVLIIISLIWTYLWIKPTEYEMQNKHIDD